jgi:hypothetical protein
MSGYIDFAVEKNCYAFGWSYGEICVGCNCCGRTDKGLAMWQARLNYNQQQLDDNLNFSEWAVHPNLIETQKANIKINIANYRAKIRYCKKKIEKLTLA